MIRSKHARTPHLPWSEGATPDDIFVRAPVFEGCHVLITEKMDGECMSVYHDGYFHARSTDGNFHPPSQWPIRQIAEMIGLGGHLPPGWRLVGENCFARHAIEYDSLPGWLLVFAAFDEANNCLDWPQTKTLVETIRQAASLPTLATVPEIACVLYDEQTARTAYTGKSACGGSQEGYVVRVHGSFRYEDWSDSVAKFVRKGHVQEGSEWRHSKIVQNRLASGD